MAAPELPGFFFDEVKKKYFKIAPNHAGSTGVYTQDRVKKAKLTVVAEREQRRTKETERKEGQRRKWRSTTSRSGFREHVLGIETGYKTNHAAIEYDQWQLWANMLTGSKDFRASRDRNISTFEVLPELRGCLTVGEKQFLSWYPDPYDHFYECSRQSTKMPAPAHRMTSSAVDTLDERVLVASGNAYCVVNVVKAGHPVVSEEQFPKDVATIWCCTASPDGRFALGGSSKSARHGVVVLTKSDGTVQTCMKPKSDVFALEYLDDNIFFSGSRDGKVRIYDSRLDPAMMNVNVPVLQHRSTITHMRALKNGHHLLVNGLENSAALYDLRFCQSTGAASSVSNKMVSVTEPTLTYLTTNLSSTTLGFDLSRSQDVFAVAGEDATVRLFSTYTAKLLRTMPLPEESHNIRFAEDVVDRTPELYVASGPVLQRWRVEHFNDF